MADNLRATEQNAALAQLARLLQGTHEFASKPFGYSNPPARMLSEALGLPATARTVERMSYGEPLTTGRGMTTRMRPDTEEALMAVSPLSQYVARVPRAAKYAVTQAAKDFAHASAAGVPHVIKPKGGNWLAGSVERPLTMLKETGVPDYERWGEGAAGVTEQAKGEAAALRKWLDTKLNKYIKNEMGTPEDPIRALAEQGRLHVDPEQLNFRQELYGKHPLEGQTFMAQHPTAKAWEGASDLQIGKMRADQLLEQGYADVNPWLAKVPPETPVHMVSDPRDLSSGLGLEHLVDELRNAVNPESGLPRELLWKYSDLDKVTVPQAVERVAAINEWRAAQQAEANAMRANNAAAALHKDYPDAPYKWVELKNPSTAPSDRGLTKAELDADKMSVKQLEDALKYEGETMGHCVGGYCPDVLEGRSRIFSLRNKKTGEPHVTIEVAPPNKEYTDTDEVVQRFWETHGRDPVNKQELMDFEGLAPEIVQIKGKANRAPKEEYLPFVQDFVRSGQWGEVGDLGNTGLLQIHPEGGYGRRGSAEHGNVAPGFYTQQELDAAMKGEGFAEGGLVEPPLPAAEFSPLEMDYIIGNVTSAQHEPAYAEGGIVESTHIPYDEAKISSLVNALREELHA